MIGCLVKSNETYFPETHDSMYNLGILVLEGISRYNSSIIQVYGGIPKEHTNLV